MYGKYECFVMQMMYVCVLLFIFRFRLLLYAAGSGVNRVQVVLSGFIVRLFCFVQVKTLCRYGCMYFFPALVLGV